MSEKTMKQIISELRGTAAELELLELTAAVQEVMQGACRVGVGVREIAAEAERLVGKAASEAAERQRALASYAATMSSAAEGQARALQEIRRALADWNI